VTGAGALDRLPPEARARLREQSQPEWVAPMLATLTDERFSRDGWLFEPKWDGERCLAFRSGRELRLLSRTRKPLNQRYPEIAAAFQRQQAASLIADGEIVAFENGITSFAKLQRRMQVEHPSAELLRSVPVWLYLFDLLYLDRFDIREVRRGAPAQAARPGDAASHGRDRRHRCRPGGERRLQPDTEPMIEREPALLPARLRA